MKPKSGKQKARRLQGKLAADIREAFGLSEADVRPAIMSESGLDIKLSEAARIAFPFAVEAKANETLPLWASIAQAQENASNEALKPLLAFKRNRSGVYVVLRWDDLLPMAASGRASEAFQPGDSKLLREAIYDVIDTEKNGEKADKIIDCLRRLQAAAEEMER